MRILSDTHVQMCMTMAHIINVNRDAFVLQEQGFANIPARTVIPVPHHQGATLFKPGFLHGTEYSSLGLKLVSVRPENAKKNLPTVAGVIMLVDESTAIPSVIMNATYLTAYRTAAGSGVATRILALPNASTLIVYGAGLQAKTHLEAMFSVRPIKNVTICNRTVANAHALADWLSLQPFAHGCKEVRVAETEADADHALQRADIIVVATNSNTPVFKGSLLKPGAHINAIGSYTTAMQEMDVATISRSISFVDNPPEQIISGTGDYHIPISKGLVQPTCIRGTIGQLLTDAIPGRSNPNEITIFKSVGNAVQDMATAAAVLKVAIAKNIGLATEF